MTEVLQQTPLCITAPALSGKIADSAPRGATPAGCSISRAGSLLHVVREDYHRQVWISYDEARLVSGLSYSHLRTLVSQKKVRGAARGVYRVNHQSLLDYLRRA